MTAADVHLRIDAAPDLPADAPTVVFSNSLGSSLSMWDPQVQALSGTFRIVRYDIRGHGQSPAPESSCTIDDLADDLLQVLDRCELGRVHLVGLSLGGMTAMKLAARNSERVDRLALLCTSARLTPAQGWRDRAASVRANGTASLAATVVDRWFTAGFAAAHPKKIAGYQEMVAGTSAAGYAACCEAIAAMDLQADLPKITAPTVLFAGAQDPATPPSHLEAIAEMLPNSRVEILDPGAHLANAEQPERVNAVLLEHFRAT